MNLKIINFSIYKQNEEDINNNSNENKIKLEIILHDGIDINKKNEQENKFNERNEGLINDPI